MNDPFKQRGLNYRSYFQTMKRLYQKPLMQTSTTLILTVATIAFFGLVAIRPTITTIISLQTELNEKQELNQELEDKIRVLGQIQQTFLEHEETLTVFDRAIPFSQLLERLLWEVEYMASENQIILQGLRTGEITTYSSRENSGSGFETFTLDLTAIGEYSDIAQFLNQLQNYQRYLVIERVAYSQPTELGLGGGNIVVSVRLRAYWDPGSPVSLNQDL